MFKELNFINRYVVNNKYNYVYRIIDSDFTCEFVTQGTISSINNVAHIIKEYHKRNLDIVRNVYLVVQFLNGGNKDNYQFIDVLNYLSNSIDDVLDINGLSFKDDIYPGVKQMYETLDAFE